MENEDLTVEVISVSVSNLARNIESKNTIKIYLKNVIEELIEDEISGMVTHLESYESPLVPNSQIRLQPHNLTSSHMSQLLRGQQVPYYEYLGQHMANGIDRAFANDDSLRQPVYVTFFVKFIEVRRFVLSPVVSVPRGASEEVFQRLVEEQRMEATCLEVEDETCSICIENLLENIVIQMPRCLHMFHQDCLFEWLGRQNSCPLCRRVPYEEETQMA